MGKKLGYNKLHKVANRSRVPATLIYNPKRNIDKLTKAYAAVTRKRVIASNCLLTPSTGTRILGLARRAGVKVKDLLDRNNPLFDEYEKSDMSDDDWAKLLVKQPDLLKTPIVVKENEVIILNRPKEIFKI